MKKKKKEIMKSVLNDLAQPESYKKVYHQLNHQVPMPSIEDLSEIMNLLKTVLFPGSFGISEVTPDNMEYYLGANLDKLIRLLEEQIKRGYCFSCLEKDANICHKCEFKAHDAVLNFIGKLPKLRYLLAKDVDAAYIGDPAAKSRSEIIFCYPSIITLIHHRIAHELLLEDIPIIPRIISEMAHSKTGIDIHPGATISEGFFVDHGTGTVIGETCVIGKNVRLYHGVTLGAKSFPLDKDGNPLKGMPRHPVVEDDVIIYSGSTILGRVTIGKGAVIGGNMWVTKDILAGERMLPSNKDSG